MKRIHYLTAFLSLLLFIGYTARAQSTAQMNVTFSAPRASATPGNKEFDVLVAAGPGYSTDNSIYTPNNSNPNGSWTSINLRFTQAGPAPFAIGDFTVSYPVAGFTGGQVTNLGGGTAASGSCYVGTTALAIAMLRDSPAPDAGAIPRVIATVTYPDTHQGQVLTIRNTTTQPCATRESFWSNTNVVNSNQRIPIMGNSTATPLPVELTAFTATKQGEDGQLNWTTASEKNSAYFEVQASADGQQYKTIGRVDAAGTSSTPRRYALLDRRIARYGTPLVYYRLRQVDADGTATFSPLRTLAPDAAAWAVTAYPNPFAQDLSAEIISNERSPVTLELYDAAGRQVLHHQVAGSAGQQLVDLRSTGLPTGAYMLYVRQGNHVGTVRLTKE